MSDAHWARLCRVAEVPASGVIRVCIEGAEPLAVIDLAGVIYVLSDTCSHGMASLSEGEIDADQIICPFHGGSFAIATGLPLRRPCTTPIRSYAVSIRDDDVYVALGAQGAA